MVCETKHTCISCAAPIGGTIVATMASDEVEALMFASRFTYILRDLQRQLVLSVSRYFAWSTLTRLFFVSYPFYGI